MNDEIDSAVSDVTVLYIEDNPSNIHLMEDIFEEFLNYNLLTALEAQQGIDLAREKKPQLIIMDINMKGMNGFQALEVIQADPDIADTPVVALSADAMPHQIEEGLSKGFTDYWSKPFNIIELIGSLKNRLGE